MARNRMIKPEFWSSETLMRVSRDARLTFIGLWNFCDDYGFCLSSTRSIIGDVYPYDETVTEAKLSDWLAQLVEEKLIIPVDYNSKHLFFIKGWGEHQTVQHKSKRSFVKVDDLEEVIKGSLKSHESLIEVYLESHAPKRKRKKKEKEESNKEKSDLPIYIDHDLWNNFMELRVRLKAVNSEKAIDSLLKTLSESPSQANAMIEQSIVNSWKGVFALKNNQSHDPLKTANHGLAMNKNAF